MPPSFVVDFTALLLLGPHATIAGRNRRSGHARAHRSAAAASHSAERSSISSPSSPRCKRRVWCTRSSAARSAPSPGRGKECRSRSLSRLLRREERVGGNHRAAPHQATDQSIVADKHPARRSGLLHRRQRRRRVGGDDRLTELWELCRWPPCRCISPTALTRAYVIRLDEDHRRREVIDSLDQGMSVVDSNGMVTLWNERSNAFSIVPANACSVVRSSCAVPALGKTELPRLDHRRPDSGTPRTLAHLALPRSRAGERSRSKSCPSPMA